MELLDRLVQRRAVDNRVVRRNRNPQYMDVLVLQRTGQVVVHLVEAQRERPLNRFVVGLARPNCLGLRLKGGKPFQRRVGGDVGGGTGSSRGRQVKSLDNKLRDSS